MREFLFRPDTPEANALLSALKEENFLSAKTETSIADKFINLLKVELHNANIKATPVFQYENTLIHIKFSLNDKSCKYAAGETAEQTTTREAALANADQAIYNMLTGMHSDDNAVQQIINLLKRGHNN